MDQNAVNTSKNQTSSGNAKIADGIMHEFNGSFQKQKLCPINKMRRNAQNFE